MIIFVDLVLLIYAVFFTVQYWKRNFLSVCNWQHYIIILSRQDFLFEWRNRQMTEDIDFGTCLRNQTVPHFFKDLFLSDRLILSVKNRRVLLWKSLFGLCNFTKIYIGLTRDSPNHIIFIQFGGATIIFLGVGERPLNTSTPIPLLISESALSCVR